MPKPTERITLAVRTFDAKKMNDETQTIADKRTLSVCINPLWGYNFVSRCIAQCAGHSTTEVKNDD